MCKPDPNDGIPCYCPTCSYHFATLKVVGGNVVLLAGLQIHLSINSFCPMCRSHIKYDTPVKSYGVLWERYLERLTKTRHNTG